MVIQVCSLTWKPSTLPFATLADVSTTIVFNLGTTHITPTLSLSLVLYVHKKILIVAIFLPPERKHKSNGLYYLDFHDLSRSMALSSLVSHFQHHCRPGNPSVMTPPQL